jgi:hypothetical protein
MRSVYLAMSTEIEAELRDRSDSLAAATGNRAREARADVDLADHLLRVRVGHGANCSSIGSVVDTLFATAVVGAAVFAAVVAALKSEEVRVTGRSAAGREKDGRETGRDAAHEKGTP